MEFLLIPAVDIGVDILNGLCDLRGGLDLLFDALQRVHYGGMVPSAELLTDLLQGKVGHSPDLVHGDLPCQHRILGPALTPNVSP